MILNSKIKKVQVFFLVSPPPLLLFLTGNMLLHVTCTFQMQMCMCTHLLTQVVLRGLSLCLFFFLFTYYIPENFPYQDISNLFLQPLCHYNSHLLEDLQDVPKLWGNLIMQVLYTILKFSICQL